MTGNIHDSGSECWQSSGGGICFRNPFSCNNGQYGGSSSLPVTPVTPVTSFCNRLNIYTKSTHYCTCLYFLNGMIYMSIYIYEYIYICVFFFLSSCWCGGGRGWVHESVHTPLARVWSGHTWHVLYLTHGPRGMSAEHVPTPALTHIGLRPTRTQKLRSQKEIRR